MVRRTFLDIDKKEPCDHEGNLSMDQIILSLGSTTKVNLDDNYNSKYIPVKKPWQRTFHWCGEVIF